MRATTPRWLAGWAASAVLVGGLGCDGKPSVTTSETKAKVSGKVVVNGKLATGGEVIFDGSSSGRPSVNPVRAPIGKDGSYTVEAFIGDNRVSFAGRELTKMDSAIQYERIRLNVQSTDNSFDIELPSKK